MGRSTEEWELSPQRGPPGSRTRTPRLPLRQSRAGHRARGTGTARAACYTEQGRGVRVVRATEVPSAPTSAELARAGVQLPTNLLPCPGGCSIARTVPSPGGGPTSTERSARLEVHVTVPPGTDAGPACRALVHALARLAVSRALAEGAAEEEPDAGGGLRALLDDAPGR